MKAVPIGRRSVDPELQMARGREQLPRGMESLAKEAAIYTLRTLWRRKEEFRELLAEKGIEGLGQLDVIVMEVEPRLWNGFQGKGVLAVKAVVAKKGMDVLLGSLSPWTFFRSKEGEGVVWRRAFEVRNHSEIGLEESAVAIVSCTAGNLETPNASDHAVSNLQVGTVSFINKSEEGIVVPIPGKRI